MGKTRAHKGKKKKTKKGVGVCTEKKKRATGQEQNPSARKCRLVLADPAVFMVLSNRKATIRPPLPKRPRANGDHAVHGTRWVPACGLFFSLAPRRVDGATWVLWSQRTNGNKGRPLPAEFSAHHPERAVAFSCRRSTVGDGRGQGLKRGSWWSVDRVGTTAHHLLLLPIPPPLPDLLHLWPHPLSLWGLCLFCCSLFLPPLALLFLDLDGRLRPPPLSSRVFLSTLQQRVERAEGTKEDRHRAPRGKKNTQETTPHPGSSRRRRRPRLACAVVVPPPRHFFSTPLYF